MAAADKLVIVENSGSLVDEIDRKLLRGLEELAEGADGCSYAFQRSGYPQDKLLVDFYSTGAQGLSEIEGSDAYSKSLAHGGGGTYLSELFGMALAKHVEVHGQKPSQIVFWSDFVDVEPTKQSLLSQAKAEDSLVDLKGVDVMCVVVGAENGDASKPWSRALAKETGAFCIAIPAEALAANDEAKIIEQAAAAAPLSKPAARV